MYVKNVGKYVFCHCLVFECSQVIFERNKKKYAKKLTFMKIRATGKKWKQIKLTKTSFDKKKHNYTKFHCSVPLKGSNFGSLSIAFSGTREETPISFDLLYEFPFPSVTAIENWIRNVSDTTRNCESESIKLGADSSWIISSSRQTHAKLQ